jgi:hypothetical protein
MLLDRARRMLIPASQARVSTISPDTGSRASEVVRRAKKMPSTALVSGPPPATRNSAPVCGLRSSDVRRCRASTASPLDLNAVAPGHDGVGQLVGQKGGEEGDGCRALHSPVGGRRVPGVCLREVALGEGDSHQPPATSQKMTMTLQLTDTRTPAIRPSQSDIGAFCIIPSRFCFSCLRLATRPGRGMALTQQRGR